jgi:hypothetical protein
MFGFTGLAFNKIRHMQNMGKRGRHSLDQWDRVRLTISRSISSANLRIAKYRDARPRPTRANCFTVMDRDRRLTGYLRGQTANVEAPVGFELNNPWRVCNSYQCFELYLCLIGGNSICIRAL